MQLSNNCLKDLLNLAGNATPGMWDEVTDWSHHDGDPDTAGDEYCVLVKARGNDDFIATTGHNPQAGNENCDVPNAEANAAYIAAMCPATMTLLLHELLQRRAEAAAAPGVVGACEPNLLTTDCPGCPLCQWQRDTCHAGAACCPGCGTCAGPAGAGVTGAAV